MANIVIVGAGVMGSALAVPASVANNVSLVGTFLDDEIIRSINQSRHHPNLNIDLPDSITALYTSDQNERIFEQADVIVIGVSSPGVQWALDEINRYGCQPDILALVTKGLVAGSSTGAVPRTYAQFLADGLTAPAGRIVGIGGPCIARELALGFPTWVSFASHQMNAANELRDLLQTDTYRIATGDDFTGLEACAALKNFMCIGISAMLSAYELDETHAKNPVAALFNQAVQEIAILSSWIVSNAGIDSGRAKESPAATQSVANAFDLAGMGDLHVTVGGGRNSRLGRHLGTGVSLQEVLQTSMAGVTVEGVDTGRILAHGFHTACSSGDLDPAVLPLTRAILDVIEHDSIFEFNFNLLPG